MKKYIVLGTACLAVLAVASCKKTDDSTTTTPALSGLSINEAPAFVAKGTSITYKANLQSIAVSKGELPTLGLYWQVNTAKKDTLTKDTSKSNPDFVYTADTLGTYNVFCYAFAAGCYNTSASNTFTAVDPEKVITGLKPEEEITVSGITWQTSNLNAPGYGLSFRNSPVLDQPMGRLYSWEEAQTVCPAGWHLPSAQDFATSFASADGVIKAEDLMADASFNGDKMWEYWPQIQINNKHGFNAVPVGYIDSLDAVSTYTKWGEYACWWTSDTADGQGVYLYLFEELPAAQTGKGDKSTLYMSVRCVRD